MFKLVAMLVLAISPAVSLAGGYGYFANYSYGYAQPYYSGGYYAPQFTYYAAGIYGGRWFAAGYWNGYYRQGYGYDYGIILPTAPLTTQVLTLPAGLPQMTTLQPAPPAQTVAPKNGLSAQDIADLKELLKELRKPQPPVAK